MWKFQINESNQWDGWNDPGVREFKANILKSLAREMIQNSFGATLNINKPVKVNFNLENLNRNNIPDIDELNRIIDLILNQEGLREKEGEDREKEINDALNNVKKETIPVLLIEDYNTTGMEYKDKTDRSSDYFRYMYATGSTGANDDRGGSHGLGKAAPLAATPLRTIFVSSCWESNGQLKKVYQGRCKLMSRVENGEVINGTGFWGREFEPVETITNKLYDWLERTSRGTTISIPGFRLNSKHAWNSILSGYIVSEFFAALKRGNLEVIISDKTGKKNKSEIIINKDTIKDPKEFFQNEFIKEEINEYENNESSDLENSYWYYQCLDAENDNVIVKTKEIKNLGLVKLSLIVAPETPKVVCLIRKDMKITEDLRSSNVVKGLWKPQHVPPNIKDFVGVVEVLNPEGNKLIRSMEPPQHNALHIDNLPNDDREVGKKALTDLSSWIKKVIQEVAPADIEKTGVVSELSEYFYDSDTIDPDAPTVTTEKDPNSGFLIQKRKRVKKLKKSLIGSDFITDFNNEGEDGGDSVGGKGSGDGLGGGEREGEKTGGTGEINRLNSKKYLKIKHQRFVGKNSKFLINLLSDEPQDSYIEIYELGLDTKRISPIKSSNKGKVVKGILSVSKDDFINNKLKVDIELNNPAIGGLTLLARIIE